MENEDNDQIEALRKSISRRITAESDRLVQEIFTIAYDHDVEAKVRLSAISMLIERSLPKLGVTHTREEEGEERGSHKALRMEIEQLMTGNKAE